MKALEIPVKNSQDPEKYHTVSVRMTNELVARIDDLAGKSHRSRNEVINVLLRESIGKVRVEK